MAAAMRSRLVLCLFVLSILLVSVQPLPGSHGQDGYISHRHRPSLTS